MSWGYFADLELTLPTGSWRRLKQRRCADIKLEHGWSGLEDDDLERCFGDPTAPEETFGGALDWECWTEEGILRIEADGDNTIIRVCAHLDKSALDEAFPLAALLHAARSEGGTGSLRLVNDRTYEGEDGSKLTLAKGRITASKLEDCARISDELLCETAGLPPPPKNGPRINPFTGQVIAPPSTPKASSGKTADKKASAKKRPR